MLTLSIIWVVMVAGIFMNMVLAGVLGFFALQTILWLTRSLAERNRGASPAEWPGKK